MFFPLSDMNCFSKLLLATKKRNSQLVRDIIQIDCSCYITRVKCYPNLGWFGWWYSTDLQRACKVHTSISESRRLLHSTLWQGWWLRWLEWESLVLLTDHTSVHNLSHKTRPWGSQNLESNSASVSLGPLWSTRLCAWFTIRLVRWWVLGSKIGNLVVYGISLFAIAFHHITTHHNRPWTS